MRPVIDYRIGGPEEARRIALGHRMCETAPNGTGTRCLCGFDCANYWLRANGYKGEMTVRDDSAAPPVKARRRWWGKVREAVRSA